MYNWAKNMLVSHDVQVALSVSHFTFKCEVCFPNLPVSASGCGTFKPQHACLPAFTPLKLSRSSLALATHNYSLGTW